MVSKVIIAVIGALAVVLMATPSEAVLKIWRDGLYQNYYGAVGSPPGVCFPFTGKVFDNQVSSLEATGTELWHVYDRSDCTGQYIPVGNSNPKIPRMSQTSLGNDNISSAYRVL